MKTLLRLSFIFILILSFSNDSDAQSKRRKKRVKEENKELIKPVDEKIEVTLKNGNVLVGELIRYDKDSLVIMSDQFGRLAFASDEIKEYSGGFGTDEDEGVGYNMEKYQNKYFLLPTARPAGKGNYYYSNYYIFGNSFVMGLSDNFTLTGGFEAISLFAGRIPLMYVSPKLSLPISDDIHLGVGSTVFVSTFDDDFNVGGIFFGNATFGSATKNFTAGLAYGFANDDFSDSPALLQLGFAIPLSKKVSLIGESFSSFSFEGAFNLGLRIVTKGNFIFDAGFTRPLGFDDDLGGIGIPLLSFSVPL